MHALLFYLHRRLAIVAIALLGLFGACSGDLRAMHQRHSPATTTGSSPVPMKPAIAPSSPEGVVPD